MAGIGYFLRVHSIEIGDPVMTVQAAALRLLHAKSAFFYLVLAGNK